LLLDVLLELLGLFGFVWDADRRPEARRLTLGCAVVVALIGGGVIAWFLLRR